MAGRKEIPNFLSGRTSSRMRTPRIAILAFLLAACADGPTDPPGALVTIEIERGGGQHGLAGEVLPEEIRVRVTEAGVPRVGESLQLSVLDDGAIVSAIAVTDMDGRGSIRWRLGPNVIGNQRLRVMAGGVERTIEATAHPPESADVVIVRGDPSGIRGIVIGRDGGAGDLAVVQKRMASDTIVRLQPVSSGPADIIVFPWTSALSRSTHSFTTATDTFIISLQPPVELDVRIRIVEGPFEEKRAAAEQQLAWTAAIWREQGAGLEIGAVSYLDETASGANTDVLTNDGCTGPRPGDIITINYVRSINRGANSGFACGSMIYIANERSQNLLAHELGHLLSLKHAPTGVMNQAPPGRELTDGEIFQAHFNMFSAVNTLYGAHPPALQRPCWGGHLSPCLPVDFELRGS